MGPRSTKIDEDAEWFNSWQVETPANSGKRSASSTERYSLQRYAVDMAKMIQIRNVPAELHRKLKSRAALEGTSLSNYLLSEIRQVAERPTLLELAQWLQARTPVSCRISPRRILRAGRNRS